MKGIFISLLISLAFFLLSASCKKSLTNLTYNFNGVVVNPTTNTPIANYPLKLYWYKSGDGIFLWPQTINIKSLRTQSDGTFNFSQNIDTSNFSRGFALVLALDTSGDYILNMFGINAKCYILKTNYDPNAFKNVEFNLYKKANLKLILNRTQSDIFSAFRLYYTIIEKNQLCGNYWYPYSSMQNFVPNTEINISTISDTYTTIYMNKYNYNSIPYYQKIDSVKCNTDSTVIYNVDF